MIYMDRIICEYVLDEPGQWLSLPPEIIYLCHQYASINSVSLFVISLVTTLNMVHYKVMPWCMWATHIFFTFVQHIHY